MADNGSSMYISGAPDSRWDNDALHDLGQVPASAFEVVKMDTVYTGNECASRNGPRHQQLHRHANQRERGASVTLSWDVSNALVHHRLAAGGQRCAAPA